MTDVQLAIVPVPQRGGFEIPSLSSRYRAASASTPRRRPPFPTVLDKDLPREPSPDAGFPQAYLLLRAAQRLSPSAFAPERFLRAGLQNGENRDNKQPDQTEYETGHLFYLL